MAKIRADRGGALTSYAPAATTDAATRKRLELTTFTPARPNGGVLVHLMSGSYLQGDPLVEIDEGAPAPQMGNARLVVELFRRGWTVVCGGCSGLNSTKVPGKGLFRTLSGDDWTDPNRPWPEKDATWLIQKVRALARAGALEGDFRRIVSTGVSSGIIAQLVASLVSRAQPGGPEHLA